MLAVEPYIELQDVVLYRWINMCDLPTQLVFIHFNYRGHTGLYIVYEVVGYAAGNFEA
jgi:hypothetical protein